MRRFAVALALCLAASAPAGRGMAQSIQPGWTALASDRTAAQPGDSLTVLILEVSSAAASAQSGSRRETRLSGSAGAGGRVTESGNLGLQGEYEGRGQMNRSGRLLGQIGATVQEVLPNGDLRISGAQTLQIDGERTSIRLTARVRRADIGGDNTVLSSRLADAEITYDGEGSLSRSGSPALINRILSFLGLS